MNNYETGQGYIFDTEDGEDYINVLTKVVTHQPDLALKDKFRISVHSFKYENEKFDWEEWKEKEWGHSWDKGMGILFHRYCDYLKINEMENIKCLEE